MANVRTCVIFFALLVNYRLVASQPTFGTAIWCNLFCGDQDDSSDESDDDYGFLDMFDICYGCPSSSGTSATTTTAKPNQQPVHVMIPPATGLNLTLSSGLAGFLLDMVPWLPSATSAPAATTAAATTAAPAATTAAGTTAAGTTAAGTTAAATTAKA